jgi:hypothetical protein
VCSLPQFPRLPPATAACLTGRSSGPPPARRLGREAVRHIIRLAAQAPRRWVGGGAGGRPPIPPPPPPPPLADGVRSAQTLGPHGHSAGHAQGSRSNGRTVTETPVPLVHCPLSSDEPNDDQRPLRVRLKTLVSPTAPAPQILLLRLEQLGPPARLRRMAGLPHVRLTAPARSPARTSAAKGSAARRTPGGPVCHRFGASRGLRHQAVGA